MRQLAGTVRPAPSRLRFWLALFAVCTVVGLLRFEYFHLDDLARGHSGRAFERLIEELTGAYSGLIVAPLTIWWTRRHPFSRSNWWRALAWHLPALLIASVGSTTYMYVSRSLIFPVLGLGTYDYGIMSIRYLMEMPEHAIAYCSVVACIMAYDANRALRQRELLTAQLQTQLAHAQLENLRLQLQPHFLFNTLHMISSVMYEDLAAADAMLSRLSDLLRHTLQAPPAQEVPLEDELRVLRLYLDIMRARFEDRLEVSFDIAAGTRRALVPQFLLQPLVENSIEHGAPAGSGPLAIEIRARQMNGSLVVEVVDGGTGIPEGAVIRKGIGLGATEERLHQLYGSNQRLAWEQPPEGGMAVTVEIPFRPAAEAARG